MNEVQLIRRELAAQRRYGREIGASWSAHRGEFNNAYSDSYNLYFVLIVGLESRRAASHLDRLRSQADLSEAERQRLERCAREFEMLSAASASASTSDSAAAVSRLSTVVEELEAIAESRYGVDDWRRASHIDADSILEERRLRKQALGKTSR